MSVQLHNYAEIKAKRNTIISEFIAFRITKAKAKVKFRVRYPCGPECEKSSPNEYINTKAKANNYFRGIHFTFISVSVQLHYYQRSPNPPKFAQPNLSRVKQRSSPVFVPIWLVLRRCEATNLGVFDLCHFALVSPYSNGAVRIRVGLEITDISSLILLKRRTTNCVSFTFACFITQELQFVKATLCGSMVHQGKKNGKFCMGSVQMGSE